MHLSRSLQSPFHPLLFYNEDGVQGTPYEAKQQLKGWVAGISRSVESKPYLLVEFLRAVLFPYAPKQLIVEDHLAKPILLSIHKDFQAEYLETRILT